MLRSLVGSEMCIRDRHCLATKPKSLPHSRAVEPPRRSAEHSNSDRPPLPKLASPSYWFDSTKKRKRRSRFSGLLPPDKLPTPWRQSSRWLAHPPWAPLPMNQHQEKPVAGCKHWSIRFLQSNLYSPVKFHRQSKVPCTDIAWRIRTVAWCGHQPKNTRAVRRIVSSHSFKYTGSIMQGM